MTHHAVVRQAGTRDHVVVEVREYRPVPGHQGKQVRNVLCVEPGGVRGHGGRRVLEADDGDGPPAVGGGDVDVPAGDGPLDVAARLRGEVDDDRSRAHALHHFAGYEEGCVPAGDGRGGYQDVCIGDVRRQQLA